MINRNEPRTKFALQAVQKAALLAAQIQTELVPEAISKDDRSPVTVADFAAQAVVGWMLDQALPGELLVGEEAAAALRSPEASATLEQVTGFAGRIIPGATPDRVCDYIDRGEDRPGSSFWTLDPIDGTKGFLRGAQYACALAYIKRGEVQLGVLGCPNLDRKLEEDLGGEGALLVASRGEGSWITALAGNIEQAEFTPLRVSVESNPSRARLMRSFESGHTNTGQVDRFQEQLGGKADPVRIDSQAKYALLAAGRGEIYLRLLSEAKPNYREKIWDQAAGSIIVEEAGGRVTDLDGKTLDFSQGRTLKHNRGICASNGPLHDPALAALRDIQA